MQKHARIDYLLSTFGTMEKAEAFAKEHEPLDYQMLLALQGRFDESWKIGAEGDVGAYWGLWDKNEKLKYSK